MIRIGKQRLAALSYIRIGAGAAICMALIVLCALPSRLARSTKLPDQSVLTFEGIRVGTNTFYYDNRAILALRRSQNPRLLELLGIGHSPKMPVLLSSYAKNNLNSKAGIPLAFGDNFSGFHFRWTGATELRFSTQSNLVQLIDGYRSFLSTQILAFKGADHRIVSAIFENATYSADFLILRVVSGTREATNDWKILGEMRIKNPIPKNQRR